MIWKGLYLWMLLGWLVILFMMMDKQQLNKNIRDKQIELNHHTVRKNKNTQISPLHAAISREDSPSLEKQHHISPQKNARPVNVKYGNLLKQQITMNRIQDDNQLNKSRQMDLDNANYYREKYPFGFQGVKVCEEVIEKYKASNYSIQKNMLQKFQKDAEEFRRNKNRKAQHSSSPTQQQQGRFTQPSDNTSFFKEQEEANRLRLLQLQMMRERQREQQQLRRQQQERRRRKQEERRLRRQQRSEVYLKREKENLIKVGNMLREIDHKLKENSSKLSSDLRDLRNQLKQTPKFHNVSQDHLYKIASRITEDAQSCSRIPVVMYSSNLSDSRLHYDDSCHQAPRINRKQFDNSSAHMKDVLRILKKNELRLKMLTESQGTQDYQEDRGD